MPVFSWKKPSDLQKNFAAYKNGAEIKIEETKIYPVKIAFEAGTVFLKLRGRAGTGF